MSLKIKSPKVVIFSIMALGFLALTFLVDWFFIIPAVVLMILNQRELMKKK
jgi:fumarate reductase subunit C